MNPLWLGIALCAPAMAAPTPPKALLGCWSSVQSENHWDDGKTSPLRARCARFFTGARLHVSCRPPEGGSASRVVFDYTLESPGTFSMQMVEQGQLAYASSYARPHEFKLAPGQLTITSYPRLPKGQAGRSLVKTVSRFIAQPASTTPAECVPAAP
ncbi:MAG: hypothetical protein RLZZ618_2898 [Pseudomonadota bacterium]|jgi:hypothetical protein